MVIHTFKCNNIFTQIFTILFTIINMIYDFFFFFFEKMIYEVKRVKVNTIDRKLQ